MQLLERLTQLLNITFQLLESLMKLLERLKQLLIITFQLLESLMQRLERLKQQPERLMKQLDITFQSKECKS